MNENRVKREGIPFFRDCLSSTKKTFVYQISTRLSLWRRPVFGFSLFFFSDLSLLRPFGRFGDRPTKYNERSFICLVVIRDL